MRRGRLTYPGAFHHGMNRGHEEKMIFAGDDAKERFLKIVAAGMKLTVIPLWYQKNAIPWGAVDIGPIFPYD
jgi:hypothetical protein